VGEAGDVGASIVLLRLRGGALCQIDSVRRTSYGYDERIEVCGSAGLVESRRQRFRGVARYHGDKIIDVRRAVTVRPSRCSARSTATKPAGAGAC